MAHMWTLKSPVHKAGLSIEVAELCPPSEGAILLDMARILA